MAKLHNGASGSTSAGGKRRVDGAHQDAPATLSLEKARGKVESARRARRSVTELLVGPVGRVVRALDHYGLGYWLYRYRYLATFTVIGFVSILTELAAMRHALPASWPMAVKSCVAFGAGITVSFALNAFLNFQVPWHYLLRTFAWFGVISSLSFGLNMAVVQSIYGVIGEHYDLLRLGSAGALFLVGYTLHRRYTFNQARDFGLAVYACEGEDPQKLYRLVGRNCDHVHVDLVDSTMGVNTSPIRLDNIAEARRLWRNRPVVLHIMSLRPRQWIAQTIDQVDAVLVHLEAEDDLMELVFACQRAEKKVGVVWRPGVPASSLLAYLPHVDYVMVLGIREPGRSGQKVCPEAIKMAAHLNRVRARYGYEVMFDGGVKASNVSQIEAKYIVAASAVLQAEQPIKAAHVLRSGAKFHIHRVPA